jgi:hypothetical protein
MSAVIFAIEGIFFSLVICLFNHCGYCFTGQIRDACGWIFDRPTEIFVRINRNINTICDDVYHASQQSQHNVLCTVRGYTHMLYS